MIFTCKMPISDELSDLFYRLNYHLYYIAEWIIFLIVSSLFTTYSSSSRVSHLQIHHQAHL